MDPILSFSKRNGIASDFERDFIDGSRIFLAQQTRLYESRTMMHAGLKRGDVSVKWNTRINSPLSTGKVHTKRYKSFSLHVSNMAEARY